MRYTTAVTGMLGAALWAAAAVAQGPPPGPPPGMMGRPFIDDGAHRAIGAILHADGMSDDQRQAMHALMEADRTTIEPILDQLRTANENLVDALLASGAPASDTLAQLTERVADLRHRLLQRQVQTGIALRDLLGPEQLDGLAARGALSPAADVLFFRR